MKGRRIIVQAREPGELGPLLAGLGADAAGALAALVEGRVFIGVRRARSTADTVAAGDAVVVHPGRAPVSGARILSQGDGVVAAYKPPGMPTIADQLGATGSLQHEVARLLGDDVASLHATSRLDIGVSGVVLFAQDARARARLAEAREHGRYRRHYVALAVAPPSPARGVWSWSIGRVAGDPRHRAANGADSVPARTKYVTAGVAQAGAALLALEPETGRTHQIRVHAARAGVALLGDRAYGGPARITDSEGSVERIERIGLHAAWVVVDGRGASFRAEAPVPEDLLELWRKVGGEASAWSSALAEC